MDYSQMNSLYGADNMAIPRAVWESKNDTMQQLIVENRNLKAKNDELMSSVNSLVRILAEVVNHEKFMEGLK